MKTAIKRTKSIIRDEKGKVLVLALVLLVLGALILTPLLGLMNTGLHAGRTYENKTAELYAADAGLEAAIHWLMNGRPDSWGWVEPEGEEKVWIRDGNDRLHINDRYVTVTVEEHGAANIYKVTSRITGPEPGTTVMSTLWAVHVIQGCVDVTGPKTVFEGDVLITEDMTVTVGGQVDGNLVIGGDLTMEQQSEIAGDITVTGDATMNQSTTITGNICVGGDLTLEQSAVITGHVYVGGTLTLKNSATITGDVFVEGDLVLYQGAKVVGDVYVWGNITFYQNPNADIFGDVYAYSDLITITLGNPSTIHGIVYATGEVDCVGHPNRTCPEIEECPGDCDYVYPDCPDIPMSPTKIFTYEIS